MNRTERESNKKRNIIIVLLLLLVLISLGTYLTVHIVNAKAIQEQLKIGDHFYEEQKYEEAIIAYEKVLEIDPKNVDARIGVAKSYLALEKRVQAAEVLVAGIKIVPKSSDLYLKLSDVKVQQEDILGAIEILDQGYKATKNNKIQKELKEIDDNLILVADKDKVQIGKSAELKVVYIPDSTNISVNDEQDSNSSDLTNNESNVAEDKNQTSNKETDKTDGIQQDNKEEGSKEEVEKEKNSYTSNNGSIIELNDQTIVVKAKWSLVPSKYGELAEKESDANTLLAKKAGNEIVKAQVGSIEKTKDIAIEKQVLESLEIIAKSTKTIVGQNIELEAVGKDADGKDMKIKPEWSIEKGIGKLLTNHSATNTFVSDETGESIIVAKVDGKEFKVKLEVEEETFTLSKVVTGQGSIITEPNGIKFRTGDSVWVKAVAKDGWEFIGWDSTIASDSSEGSIVMDDNKTIRAIFKQKPRYYTLQVNSSGQGSVSISPSGNKFNSGTIVQATANAAEGWKFDHWEGAAFGKNASQQIKMDRSKVIKAVFVKNATTEVSITKPVIEPIVNKDPVTTKPLINLPVQEKPIKTPVVEQPKEEQPVEETPIVEEPEEEQPVEETPIVEEPEEEQPVEETPVVEEPEEEQPVEETPAQVETFKLETAVIGKGSIIKSPEQPEYEKGTSVGLEATPESGWVFDHWEGDSSATSENISITMDDNKQIKAVFVQTGSIKGIISNARTGKSIPSATIKLRVGSNVQSGSSISEVVTDNNGNYTINNIKPGTYTMEIAAANYTTKFTEAIVTSGTVLSKNESIMPIETELTDFTAVLSWNDSPRDLDAHLTGPKVGEQGRFHVYFGNKSYANEEDGIKYAELDVDDTTGAGPETITTFKQVDGIYRFYVHNYSNETPLTESGGKVELYKEGRLIKVFNIPTTGTVGVRYWHVFEINNGVLVPINQLSTNLMQ